MLLAQTRDLCCTLHDADTHACGQIHRRYPKKGLTALPSSPSSSESATSGFCRFFGPFSNKCAYCCKNFGTLRSTSRLVPVGLLHHVTIVSSCIVLQVTVAGVKYYRLQLQLQKLPVDDNAIVVNTYCHTCQSLLAQLSELSIDNLSTLCCPHSQFRVTAFDESSYRSEVLSMRDC
jgi:hypothetical protein